MKNKKSFLIISLIFICMFIAKQNFAQNLRQYYKYINKAELAICKEKYQTASNYYKKAFSFHPFPFKKDLIFSFRINYKYLNNIEEAVKNYHRLAQCGETYPEDAVKDSIKYSVIWRHIQNIIDTTVILVIPELNDAMNRIMEKDQEVRKDYDIEDTIQGAIITMIDEENLIELEVLYAKYDRINEYSAGWMPINTVLWHSCESLLYDPKVLLLKEVLKGNANAKDYAQLEGMCDMLLNRVRSMGQLSYEPLYGTTYFDILSINNTLFIYPPKNLKKVNKKRKEILLAETWQDYLKKILYIYYHPDTDFPLHPTITAVFPEELAKQKIEQKKAEIDQKIKKGKYMTIPSN